jgi:hypothetical protein
MSTENKATFPCLVVTGSQWFKSLATELEINYEGAAHYRLCSNSPVIDVISPALLIVKWFARPTSAQELPAQSWAEDQNANTDDK